MRIRLTRSWWLWYTRSACYDPAQLPLSRPDAANTRVREHAGCQPSGFKITRLADNVDMSMPMIPRRQAWWTICAKRMLVSGAVGWLGTGCQDERPPIMWEGEHLRFGTYEDTSTICEGTLPYMDAFVGYIGELFDRPNAHVDYYWVPGEVGSYCVSIAGACAKASEVFSDRVLHKHEVVHAARPEAYLPLEEGIADLYGDQDWLRHPVPEDVPWLLEEHEHGRYVEGNGHYKSLAHFVSHLRVVGGTQSLVELGRQTTYDGSFDSLDPVFLDLYGMLLDDVVERYIDTYPVCDQTRHAANDFECGRNVVQLPAVGEAPLERSIPLDCSQPDVLGPRWGQIWTTLTFEVPATARYHVNISGASRAEIRFRRCGISCLDDRFAAPPIEIGFDGGGHCLLEGRYLLRVAVPENRTDDSSIRFEYADSGYCTAADN